MCVFLIQYLEYMLRKIHPKSQTDVEVCARCVVVCAGFTRWLNHILVPVDQYGQVIPQTKDRGMYVHTYVPKHFSCILLST